MPTLRRQVAAVTAVLALSVTAGAVGTPAFADDDRQAEENFDCHRVRRSCEHR